MMGGSFASPGTSLTSHDIKGIGDAGDNGGDRMSRTLKPSEVFKKYGGGSRDLADGRDSSPSVVSLSIIIEMMKVLFLDNLTL